MSTSTDCTRFQAALPDLLDFGEAQASGLDAGVRADLESHAAACAACAEELRTYRRTVALVRELPSHEAPPGFLAWVKTAAAAEDAATAVGARRERLRRSRPVLIAASLFLGASLAVALYLAGSWLDPDPVAREEPALAKAPAPAAAVAAPAALLTVVIPRSAWRSLPADLEGELRGLVDRAAATKRRQRAARPPAALDEGDARPALEAAAASEELGAIAAREATIGLAATQLEAAREALSTWAESLGGRLEGRASLEREERGGEPGNVQVRVRIVPGP